MSPLRKQMDDDMVVRGLADRTRETYLVLDRKPCFSGKRSE